MIIRLILLLAVIFAIFYIRQQLAKAPAQQRKSLIWKYALIAIAALVIGLAVAGRVHWISAAIAAALPFARRMLPMLIRYFPLLQHHYKTYQGQQVPGTDNQSSVNTPILAMTMDHHGGELNGEVISGPFANRSLDSMDQAELLSLLDYCQQQDMDSARLMVSYLNHRFGNDWSDTATSGAMCEEEALALLGLVAGTCEEEIIKAHRKLIQKVHPDRGGNDYLAAKINLAKDLLLSRLQR